MHSILRRLDLNLLLVLDSLFRLGSVSAAASELAISPSAFSHALARLRQALDDELFVRQGNRMLPTPRAHELAPGVAQALALLEEGLNPPQRFDPATSQRTFVLAATDYTTFALLPALMQRLEQQAPGVQLRLVQSGSKVAVDDLAQGRIDFALGFSELEDSLPADVRTHDWAPDHYLVIARHDHPRIGTQLSEAAYLAERHLVVTPWNERLGLVDRVLAERGLARRVAVQLPTLMAAPFVIRQTDLLMTIPRHAAQTLAEVAAIRLLPAPFEIPPYALRLYYHAKHVRQDAQRWLLEQLRQVTLD
ncbi:MAG: PCP degradation transcriptional activation protein [Stenotrophomonas maltophilia]|nr:MAG: PCP degradation transcriptional activation protein [Stenotrophomonas maltophilia]